MRHRSTILLLFLALALLPGAVAGQELASHFLDVGSITQVASKQADTTLAIYLQHLRSAHAAAVRNDHIGLQEVATDLLAINRVEFSVGSSAPVNNQWLADALALDQPDLPMIAARLGALIDALSYPDTPPAADAEARLQALLARPPFAQPQPRSEPTWLDRFFDWLFDLFDRMFTPISQTTSEYGSGISWLVVVVGLIIISIVLTVWLRGLRRTLVPIAQLPDDDPEANLSADMANRQASDLARSGDYRRATRMLYLATLLWLDEHKRLRYDRALTNREYLDHLDQDPTLREELRPVVETFDRVWYGNIPLDASGFAHYEGQVATLRKG